MLGSRQRSLPRLSTRLIHLHRQSQISSHFTSVAVVFPRRTHNCGQLTAAHVGQDVVLAGWLLPYRKISNSLSFFPIKDSIGTTQLVANRDTPQSSTVLDALLSVPVESVLLIQGSVRLRPQHAQRTNLHTGKIEVLIKSFSLLNRADHHFMPFLPSDTLNLANEDLRARFRHLDLRRQALSDNLRKRSQVAHTIRQVLHDEGFLEVETPALLKSSPEGAREYLVPTRVAKNSSSSSTLDDRETAAPLFYALSQSPQQPKQLLVCSGAVDKYYQFAKCFRDEDGRKDRQPEFTQVDLEMAFISWGDKSPLSESESRRDTIDTRVVSSYPLKSGSYKAASSDKWRIGGQEVRRVVESMVRRVWKEFESFDLPPEFPVMTYTDAMNVYGSDKPDTRFDLKIKDLTAHLPPAIQQVFLRKNEIIQCIHIQNDSSNTNNFRNACRKYEGQREKEESNLVDVIYVTGGNITRWLTKSGNMQTILCDPNLLAGLDLSSINESFNVRPGDIFLLSRRSSSPEGGSTALGRARLRLAQISESLSLYSPPPEPHFLWITEFPLFTRADDDKDFLAKGRWSSSHHPFTAPMLQDIDKLYAGEINSIRGQHYDLVLNGVEIGGGSVRIHDAAMQEYIFTNVLQLTESERTSFSHLLHALRCGAPPHGGIALGFDRLMSILCKTQSIRDVIAFPKTGAGTDLLFKSPSPVSDEVLEQYGIKARLQ